jgi:hypothetical protein
MYNVRAAYEGSHHQPRWTDGRFVCTAGIVTGWKSAVKSVVSALIPNTRRKIVKNPFLVGAKVYLRPLEREDAPLFVTWLNDAEVTRTLEVFYRPINLQTELDFITNVYKNEHDIVLGIVSKNTNELIGVTGLHQLNKSTFDGKC